MKKKFDFIKTKKYMLISFLIFLLGTLLVKFTSFFYKIDNNILISLPLFREINLSFFMIILTTIVSTEIVIILALMLFVWFSYTNEKIKSFFILSLTGLTALFIWVLKKIINRTRPLGYQLITETRASFPSGHTTFAVVFLGIILYLFYDKIKYKKTAITITITTILLIGISRIYLGVHWFSDVVVSIFFGAFLLLSYIYLLEIYKLKINKNKKKIKNK